jgi:hypothetical protein
MIGARAAVAAFGLWILRRLRGTLVGLCMCGFLSSVDHACCFAFSVILGARK